MVIYTGQKHWVCFSSSQLTAGSHMLFARRRAMTQESSAELDTSRVMAAETLGLQCSPPRRKSTRTSQSHRRARGPGTYIPVTHAWKRTSRSRGCADTEPDAHGTAAEVWRQRALGVKSRQTGWACRSLRQKPGLSARATVVFFPIRFSSGSVKLCKLSEQR